MKLCIASLVFLSVNNLWAETADITRLETQLGEVQDIAKVDVLNQLSTAYNPIDPEIGLHYDKLALKLLDSLSYDIGKAHTLKNISVNLRSQHLYHQALKYSEQAVALFKILDNSQETANSQLILGKTNADIGNYDLALKNYQQAERGYLQLADNHGLANALNNIGTNYWYLGDYEESIKYYLQSLTLRDQSEDKKKIADTLNNIGLIHNMLGSLKLSLDSHRQSMEIRTSLADQLGVSMSLNNIGLVYKSQGDYQQALTHHQSALKIRQSIKDKKGIAGSLNNIGNIYIELNDYHQALNYYQRSFTLKGEIDDKRGLANTANNIGESYIKLKDYDKAEAYLNQGLILGETLAAKNLIKNSYRYLSELYAVQEDYLRAFEYHQKFKDMNDRIFSAQSSEKIAKLSTRYEAEKNQQEILKLKNQQLTHQLQLEQQVLIRNFSLVSFLSLLLFSFFLLRQYTSKRRALTELEVKSEKLRSINDDLSGSLQHIKRLEGILPICCNCKSIRVEEPKNGEGWVAIEDYISEKTDTEFSHGICPSCTLALYPDLSPASATNKNK